MRSLKVKMGVLDRRVDMLIKAQTFLEQAARRNKFASGAAEAMPSASPAQSPQLYAPLVEAELPRGA